MNITDYNPNNIHLPRARSSAFFERLRKRSTSESLVLWQESQSKPRFRSSEYVVVFPVSLSSHLHHKDDPPSAVLGVLTLVALSGRSRVALGSLSRGALSGRSLGSLSGRSLSGALSGRSLGALSRVARSGRSLGVGSLSLGSLARGAHSGRSLLGGPLGSHSQVALGSLSLGSLSRGARSGRSLGSLSLSGRSLGSLSQTERSLGSARRRSCSGVKALGSSLPAH